MRVLIFGGAGFIGSSIVSHFAAQGLDVCLFDSSRRLERIADLIGGIEAVEFEFGKDDPACLPQMRNADAIVHLACTTTPALSMRSFSHDAASNIVPSLKLFDAAMQAGVRRIVFASSGGTVYGAPEHLPIRECVPTEPLSAYGVSKRAIENYLSLYDLEGIALRIANPYGPYQLRGSPVGVIARYAKSIRDGEAIEMWGDGSIVRDYIAIEDVAEAFCLAVTVSGLSPGAYNVGSGVGTSLNQVAEYLFEIAGTSVAVRRTEGRSYDVPAIALDSSKLTAATGWRPRVPLEEGMKDIWRHASGT